MDAKRGFALENRYGVRVGGVYLKWTKTPPECQGHAKNIFSVAFILFVSKFRRLF
jgi:hypothetical protein